MIRQRLCWDAYVHGVMNMARRARRCDACRAVTVGHVRRNARRNGGRHNARNGNKGDVTLWARAAGGAQQICRGRAIATRPPLRRYLMRIFVGNLAYTTTDAELRQVFEPYGAVGHVMIFMDRDTGRSRGFGFVEMPDSTEAKAAIAGLNGTSLGGRPLTVNEARKREERGG